jgi:hypothetical protein
MRIIKIKDSDLRNCLHMMIKDQRDIGQKNQQKFSECDHM